jgi:hypothetical protein
MREDVDFGVLPVDQCAVEPDFVGLDHCHGYSSGMSYVKRLFKIILNKPDSKELRSVRYKRIAGKL